MSIFSLRESPLFRADSLTFVMAGLILFVVANVLGYSRRYLAGDQHQRSHQIGVLVLGASVMMMAFADHLLIFLIAWMVSNLLLVRLMIHKGQWIAARNSGYLAFKVFAFGGLALGVGFFLLATSAGTASIAGIVQSPGDQTLIPFAGLLLVAIAAVTQSAAWPFHRWLMSSLNSPTPVSALMHAGLINGGGFLLARFAPLYISQPILLHGLFLVGLVTAVVGTFWKLLQTDVKRMLACSTMGQMGFMLMQCGMGLFAPAISHLCWHGLFKACLFLNAGSVVREKRTGVTPITSSPLRVVIALVAGSCGCWMFALASGLELSYADTTCLMPVLAFIASTQLALGILEGRLTTVRILISLLAAVGAGGLYGLSIRAIDTTLVSLDVMHPQPMDPLYFTGIGFIVVIWIAMTFRLSSNLRTTNAWKRIYMAALNSSQPHPGTITATRTTYQA